jgi:hypothetical protein
MRAPARARLRVELNLPRPSRGARATLVVVPRSGPARLRPLALDARGDGHASVPFRRSELSEVVLVLANTSTRLRCWRGSELSCQGAPLDDATPYRYRARLLR